MKKIIIILLTVIAVSFTTSCNESTKTVYLYIYDMKDPFMEDYANAILEYAEGNFHVELFDAQNSQIIQNEEIEEGLENNPDLIIVNPVDRLGAYTIVNKVKESGIPVIFINREPLASDLISYDKAYYVGAVASQSGIFQAEIIDNLFGNNPLNLNEFDLNDDNIIQTVIFKGEQSHQDAELRTEFVQSTLIDLGYTIDVLSIQTADWNMQNAYLLAKNILIDYGEQIELVISNNDAMALGVIQAMVELNYIEDSNLDGKIQKDTEAWVPVIGIDGIHEALEKLENGYLYATIKNDSDAQAVAVIQLSVSILNNTDFISTAFNLVDGKYIWVDYQKEY
ncbi:MAG: galactose ABC transporter substrate-binding protein [Tenericutes bacterium]|nr:galactose ABC transporter substrate-binding protein [Mycoplasmatota bacterium]